MISYTDLKFALTSLGLTNSPVIAHASLRAFGAIDGGAESLVNILLASTRGIIMPCFTYRTMVVPEVGPPNNAISYGSQRDLNRLAEPFHPGMPADKMMGILPEILRKHPAAVRTFHPILSFCGIEMDAALATQTIFNPLAPVASLAEQDGWVLLLGVDHTVNTAIHYAEKLASRKQFIRWGLTPERVVECPNFPGDSSGFEIIAPELEGFSRFADVQNVSIQAAPLKPLLEVVVQRLRSDPTALLCSREDCERCNEVRSDVTRDYFLRTHRPIPTRFKS
jgi:aminoglycoside 3-N-acetyltransferase